ncbi:MAG TPA: sigma-54 dependent transcriptional regulator [Longimicrobiales bacterium]|nr:sigma-54 dependent transcriptional regulator [Longimicrobiales bacterium]
MNATEMLSLTDDVKKSIRVLIVDDEHTLRESCASVLGVEGFDISVCGKGMDALVMLKRRPFDIVLLDLHMTQVSGMQLLETCLETHPDTIAIIMTGNPSVESSIAALRAGAWDYLPKPFAASHLQILIGRAAHAVLVGRESKALESTLEKKHGHSEKVTLLGNSVAFQRVVALARKVAATDASVFISGESGTGKEQIAQFIHHHSRRSSRQLVAVNCAALPEALLETEMFGHVQGAFTGAVKDKAGLLEVANGGTLFLDEITEMPAPLQAKLLRVIQDGVVRRLGSTTTDAVVNVRFIAATNRNLRSGGSDDVMRQDLYYRLCVVPIHIPPLRERPSDIPVLAQHFLTRYWAQHRENGAPEPTFTSGAIESLQARAWAGNVRELQNVIEHSVVLLEPGAQVGVEDLPDMSGGGPAPAARSAGIIDMDDMGEESYHGVREKVLMHFELGYLTWLVGRAGGNMSKAARIAGVDRTTLYRLMEKHGLQRDTIITSK